MTCTGVSILIPTYNRGAILDRTLRSLSEMDLPGDLHVELVVVANACTDDTEQLVRSWVGRMGFPVRCVPEPNPGLGNARNRCVHSSSHEICALLDDDVWVTKGWLFALRDAYQTTPAGVIAGHIELWWDSVPRPDWLTPGMETTLSCLDLGPSIVEMFRPDAIGANFSFRREVFDRVGPFRADLDRIGKQLLGGGETFFVQQALKHGFRIFYAPGVSVKHWVSPHRVEEPYLTGVALGTSCSIVMLKERYGPIDALRTVAIGSVRYLAHALAAPVAGFLGAKGTRMRWMVRKAIGRGQVKGALARLRIGSLASQSTPKQSP